MANLQPLHLDLTGQKESRFEINCIKIDNQSSQTNMTLDNRYLEKSSAVLSNIMNLLRIPWIGPAHLCPCSSDELIQLLLSRKIWTFGHTPSNNLCLHRKILICIAHFIQGYVVDWRYVMALYLLQNSAITRQVPTELWRSRKLH